MSRTISNAKELTGVFIALFTPLKNDDSKNLYNSIDYKKAEKMIDDLVDAGISGIVSVGTTGQSATLTTRQHVDFIKFTFDYVGERLPVIAGAGSNCTRETIETVNIVQKTVGKITCLCVTGYYNNPPQKGLVKHYETVTAETGAKIILYNVPSRTNSYLEPDTVIHLSENKNIIGLKQAVDFVTPGKMREDTLKIVQNVDSEKFTLVTGEDDALFAILKMGGKGIITATGNIPEAARLFCDIIKNFNSGKHDKAEDLQKQVLPFVKACFIRKNPIPLATLFNSPIYKPLISVKETEGGEEVYLKLIELVNSSATSLKKYF